MTAPGASPGAGTVAAQAYEHEGFQYALKLYFRSLVLYPHKTSELLDALAGYVAAHDDDSSFREAWSKLHKAVGKAGGTSATGMVGMSREEVRARSMRLIVEAARKAHILENGNARATPQTWAEKKDRLAAGRRSS